MQENILLTTFYINTLYKFWEGMSHNDLLCYFMLQLLTERDLSNFVYIPSYRNTLTTSVLLAVRMFLKKNLGTDIMQAGGQGVCEHPRMPLRAHTCTWLQLHSLLFKSITNYHMFPCRGPGQGG